MKFYGTFNSYDNEQKYLIRIGPDGDWNETEIKDPTDDSIYEIAGEDLVVLFDESPVSISADRQDLLKRIIISQATINLLSNRDLTTSLFAQTNTSIPVTITEVSIEGEPKHVFFGYVDPLQFSQGYAHNYETITINATDPLGALEDYLINQVTDLSSQNNELISAKTEISPYDLIRSILAKIGVGINTDYVNSTVLNAMRGTKIHCTIFFGDDPDDYKDLYNVLENVCKYFNLYIAMQDANTAMIYCTVNGVQTGEDLSNFKDLATDASTSISMDDVYSQITLTCNIEPVEDIVTSFSDDDSLYSDYDTYEHYMTEYFSEMDGDNVTAMWPWWGFWDILNDYDIASDPNSYPYCYKSDNYVYVLRNNAWNFGPDGKSYIGYMGGTTSYSSVDGSFESATPMNPNKHQYDVLYWLAEQRNICKGALLGFAKGPNQNLKTVSDNSVQQSLDLDKWLVISTMGNRDNNSWTLDTYTERLERNSPICSYTGLTSNILSPQDPRITNFLIISGNILLNPLQGLSGRQWGNGASLNNTWDDTKDFWQSYQAFCWELGHGLGYVVGLNSNYMYYQQKWDKSTSQKGGIRGFLNNNAAKELKFEYSAPGNTNDTISKLPILACQLKVGTKYCVEQLWLGEAGVNNFKWMTAMELYNLQENLGYEVFWGFTLGIDPKIGDYIIGQKYQISNTIDYSMNIDKTGTAIPIKESDKLSGAVEFKICGAYNAIWNKVTYFEQQFWLYTWKAWFDNPISILSNIQSVMVGDLKIEMASNNGGKNELKTTADNDLVYYSLTNPQYMEKQEEDVDICTPLTLDECDKWGIKVQNSNSYVYKSDNSPFRGFGPTGEEVKPEQCLIDYLYKEYCVPSRILSTQLKAEAINNGLYGNSMNNQMLTTYYSGLPIDQPCRIMKYDADLKYKTIDLEFRQHNTIDNIQLN